MCGDGYLPLQPACGWSHRQGFSVLHVLGATTATVSTPAALDTEVLAMSDQTDDPETGASPRLVIEDPEPAGPLKALVQGRVWNAFILWVIMANMISMALYRPTEPTDSAHNATLETVEFVFMIVFTVEMVLKLIALQLDYFADGWNRLDFIIVLSGYLMYLPGDITGNVKPSVFRTIRVLRPLRSIGMMPGVRLLIDALIMSLPGLGTLLVLIAFVYAIFGILGVQLFKELFLYHCVPLQHCIAAENTTYTSLGYCGHDDGLAMPDGLGCQQFNVKEDLDLVDGAALNYSCVNATLPDPVPKGIVHSGAFGYCTPPEGLPGHPDLDVACPAAFGCVRTDEQVSRRSLFPLHMRTDHPCAHSIRVGLQTLWIVFCPVKCNSCTTMHQVSITSDTC